MTTFLFENGDGKVVDEHGNEVHVYQMEIDNEQYPLEQLTSYDQYLDLKPPEKATIMKIEEREEESAVEENAENRITTTYRSYKDSEKEKFFYYLYEKGMSIRGAAAELKIPKSTAYEWKKKFEEGGDVFTRKEGSGRPVGRPAILNEEHQKYLVEMIDENPSLVLDQMMDSLTSQFEGLQISKTAFYNFVKDKCRISVKRAYFHSVERNSPAKIRERKEWVQRWQQTDMDYISNCIFIDESGFNINMKRSIAWAKKGERAIVKVPKTKASNITILGAISSYGVVNICVRRPRKAEPSKKRKVGGGTSTDRQNKGKKGIVTGHYFNFIASTLDVLDKHEQLKGHYIIMDNAPIHTHVDIQTLIEARGYGCICLPSYTPELNPIEQFWSVCKSKLKRETLLKEETLTTRITEACNNIYISDLQSFCQYSAARFKDCLDEKPL
ncbi:hypothetical protein [Parasitella parasitica]|uniref:Tc1-like transposase DDE domain-containing protein n=1 Tax=Parasitella parasitica TaxID=35722 RepID=A0A0B7NHW5_9FUNG|nr:hypothetical protein [Parasitella parasitica]